MTPNLRKAIIKHIPEYFSWNEARQEKYRANLPDDVLNNIKCYLINQLFGLTPKTEDEMDDVLESLTEEQLTQINAEALPIYGIGEDKFFLNESFGDGVTVLDFETLYDYDFNDHKFQQKEKLKESKNYVVKPYYGSLNFTWARLFINNDFYYGMLSMMSDYINNKLDIIGSDYIDDLIPNEYVPGPNHGKSQGEAFVYDMKRNANGLEGQLDELNARFWKYLDVTKSRLNIEFDKTNQDLFLIDESKEGDPCVHFIFRNKSVLKSIHFKTFMKNCNALEQTNHEEIKIKIDVEKDLLIQFLKSEFVDIIENYDSKILKFKKKRKILIHKDLGLF